MESGRYLCCQSKKKYIFKISKYKLFSAAIVDEYAVCIVLPGLGTRPGRHLQMGLPWALAVQEVPGPQGLGWQGSGRSTQRWSRHTRPYWQSGSTTHSGPQPGTNSHQNYHH